MHLLAFSAIDYSILGFYLIMLIVVGFYFSKEQESSHDFFLAGRSMGWFPVGLSMATLLSAMSYTGIPSESYFVGLKILLLPLGVWLLLPIMNRLVIPLYYNLGISSIYEYLEMRFSLATRLLCSVMFVLWRLLWLGGVLYAPCKLLYMVIDFPIPLELLIVILGVISTLYTFLGGMKAVIWTDVIQAITMVAGVIFIIGAVLTSPGIDFQHVMTKASELGRTEIFDFKFDLKNDWGFWTYMPHVLFSMLAFYIADQITAQRFLTTKNMKEAQKSFLLNCISNSVMIPALVFVGICLLVFYQQNPQEMRPHWVANVRIDEKQPDRGRTVLDPVTKKPVEIRGTGDRNPIRKDTIEKLVAEKKLYRPNIDKPFESTQELKDPTFKSGIDIEKLATYRIHRTEPKQNQPVEMVQEIVIHGTASDELMPWFLLNHLPVGVAGLILAALFAASMSSMDSGLNSISTLFIVDFHRRLGIGKKWLSGRLNKSEEELTQNDELRLGRPLVLVIGILATLFSLWVSQIENIFEMMIKVVNTFGGPLLTVFLLGMLSRRANAIGALASVIFGFIYTIAMHYSVSLSELGLPRPDFGFSSRWRVVLCVMLSFIVGYIVSLLTKNTNQPQNLTGLVVGQGKLGHRKVDQKP